jgi:hypothetical protein
MVARMWNCRGRIAAGITVAQNTATAVQEVQQGLLARAADALQSSEAAFFSKMLAQEKMDAETRFYQMDRSQLTMRERLEAKIMREKMLQNSVQSFQYLDSQY